MSAFDKNIKSNRLLQSKRYTLGTFTDSVESYTNVFDLGAGEIYTQTNYIPTSSLPFSGSSQDFYYYTTGSTISTTTTGNDVLRYWSKHKLTPGANGAAGDQVWFFISGSTLSNVGEQGINSDQQTNFVSNKYIEPNLAFNHAENATPGYNIIAYASDDGSTFTEIANTKYVFDYKTGVFQWLTEANKNEFILNSNYFVYVSAYQYVGKTLEGQIADGSIGGGAGSWNELTDIPLGLLSGSQQITDFGFISSSSDIASDISGSWQGQGFISASQVQENIGGGVISGSEQIANEISGSTRIYVSGSNGGFDVGQDSTLNFVSGTAGLTVLSNGSDTITIGANTDDVTFNSVTADTLTGTASFAEKVPLAIPASNEYRPLILSSGSTHNGKLGVANQDDGDTLEWNPSLGYLKINDKNINNSHLIISKNKFVAGASIPNFTFFEDGVTTINFGEAATNINMGAADGTVNIAGSASIAGDLIVQGTTTSIQTENLNVSDQFILLASGSTGTKDGGIIVQSGSNGIGTALYFDANSDRWAVNPSNTVNWNDTSLTPKQYVVSVSASADAPPATPSDFGVTSEYYGMMHVNTGNGDIYIYS